ncbi:MAG: hypothetical protein ACWA5A_07420 [Marinibacterium sp.]
MKRFFRGSRRSPPPAAGNAADPPDLDELAALAQLLGPQDPGADLLSRVEAQIDTLDGPAAGPDPRARKVWNQAGMALSVAVLAATGGYFAGRQAGPGSQQIIARPSPGANWVPLGTVTLHGPALRAFVRDKCRGHTHFYITMHGIRRAETGGNPGPGAPLAAPGEKILMECIF